VYGVGHAQAFAKGGPRFATPGIGGRGDVVRAVEYADLAAIVSDSPEMAYEVSRENVAAHQLVLEEAMTRSDVLPFSFSTVAGSDEEVREKFLKRESDELHRYLEYIRGRVELDLRVLWDRERLFAEIVSEDDEIRALRDSLAGRPPDETHHERVELGQLTQAAVTLKCDAEAEAILQVLQPLAVETGLNPNLTELMLLNASFLVDRTQVPAFDAQVQALGEAQAQRMSFRYVGPLPPYNFVNLSVNWED
jgi:hypothetical protein